MVLPGATTDGSMLLGKNSDRPVDETQPRRYVPARSPSTTDRLRLAYLEIDDARSGNPPEPGILGMELLRLGLERGRRPPRRWRR